MSTIGQTGAGAQSPGRARSDRFGTSSPRLAQRSRLGMLPQTGVLSRYQVWSTSALDTIRDRERWAQLQSVAMVRSERMVAGETSVETRLYLSSTTSNAERLANAIRTHWGVENQVHWVLDVVFADDDSRVRIDHAAHKMVIIRHIVMNMML